MFSRSIIMCIALLAACHKDAPPTTTTPAATTTAPAPAPAPAVAGASFGEKCGEGGACATGLTCVEYYGIAGPGGPAFHTCEVRCKADGDCPEGRKCRTVADGPGSVCR